MFVNLSGMSKDNGLSAFLDSLKLVDKPWDANEFDAFIQQFSSCGLLFCDFVIKSLLRGFD